MISLVFLKHAYHKAFAFVLSAQNAVLLTLQIADFLILQASAHISPNRQVFPDHFLYRGLLLNLLVSATVYLVIVSLSKQTLYLCLLQ